MDPEEDKIVGAEIKTLLFRDSRGNPSKDWVLLLKACQVESPGHFERCGTAPLWDPIDYFIYGGRDGDLEHWLDTSLDPLRPDSSAFQEPRARLKKMPNSEDHGSRAWWRPAFSPEVTTLV